MVRSVAPADIGRQVGWRDENIIADGIGYPKSAPAYWSEKVKKPGPVANKNSFAPPGHGEFGCADERQGFVDSRCRFSGERHARIHRHSFCAHVVSKKWLRKANERE